MKILLLYKGYPRISHTYQSDEAEELNKTNNIMIISFDWELLTIADNSLPYLFSHNPLNLLNDIKKFKPDFIHSHYLDTFDICKKLSKMLNNLPFTIRSHSFDILKDDYKIPKSLVSQINLTNSCQSIKVFPEFYNKLLSFGIKKEKLISSYPCINIKRFNLPNIPNGKNIMSGGAFLKKKNIADFILLSKKIKKIYPEKEITYYSVIEEPLYFNEMDKLNKENGNPVIFKTCQPSEMPLEYKKHEWLIYGACPILKTVGNPIMIAEAQASGVGVIMYELRSELIEYVTENGYLYKTHDEILNTISKSFCEIKKENARLLSDRYQI